MHWKNGKTSWKRLQWKHQCETVRDEEKMRLVVEGSLVTPVISKKSQFIIKGCKGSIISPKRRHFTKINTTKPMYPYSFICYLGRVRLEYRQNSITKLTRKLLEILKITHIGKYQREGLGQVKWINGRIEKSIPVFNKSERKEKLKIRKGLPLNLSNELQELLRYALLHDFFNTSIHRSKIYTEPPLEDSNLITKLRGHHEKTDDPLIQTFQKYDQWAAMITRKIRSPVTSRYTWQAKKKVKKIDFEELAQEIKEVSSNIWTLYKYIYDSKELGLITESMNHGHNSLRNHLLVIANLIVQDLGSITN